MMKRMLLLGGAQCQRSGIRKANAMGIQAVVVDYSENPSGLEEGTIHCKVSTFDSEACVAAAKDWKVDGVMTMGTDQPVFTAAVVAEALHLPSWLTVDQAKSVTNKKVMKKHLEVAGIPTPKWDLISLDQNQIAGKLSGPVVLKPLDAQGQRGVFRLESQEQVLEHLPLTLSYSREKEALIEEYYPSSEITVSAWAWEGELTVLSITDRLHLEGEKHIGIARGHRFPSQYREWTKSILKITKDIQEAFHITNGPLYIQLLLGAEGLLVNEVACRIGGAFEDQFIPLITGFDILENVILGALGEPLNLTALKDYDISKSLGTASVQLLFAHPGRIHGITPESQVRAFPHVVDVGYNYKVGDWIGNTENATQRLGHCVLVNPEGSVEESIKHFQQRFQVWDEKGRNLYRIL